MFCSGSETVIACHQVEKVIQLQYVPNADFPDDAVPHLRKHMFGKLTVSFGSFHFASQYRQGSYNNFLLFKSRHDLC